MSLSQTWSVERDERDAQQLRARDEPDSSSADVTTQEPVDEGD